MEYRMWFHSGSERERGAKREGSQQHVVENDGMQGNGLKTESTRKHCWHPAGAVIRSNRHYHDVSSLGINMLHGMYTQAHFIYAVPTCQTDTSAHTEFIPLRCDNTHTHTSPAFMFEWASEWTSERARMHWKSAILSENKVCDKCQIGFETVRMCVPVSVWMRATKVFFVHQPIYFHDLMSRTFYSCRIYHDWINF